MNDHQQVTPRQADELPSNPGIPNGVQGVPRRKAKPSKARLRKLIAAIQSKHGSLGRFADAIGKSRQTVSEVLNGRLTSSPIAKAAADVVGAAPHELWPDRYAEDGGPLHLAYLRQSA